jgi:4-amino-4-deoxy-L-arabinose transferase-like glycosyltransferase
MKHRLIQRKISTMNKLSEPKNRRVIFYLLGFVAVTMLLRMVFTATLPYTDTTEARYGATAQLMALTNDWTTPWFEPGVPFWGKPPLAFWAQAASFEALGITEFAGRLPSWLATLGILILTYIAAKAAYAKTIRQPKSADVTPALAVAILSTMVFTFVSAGTVMTDSFLVFGVTLTITSLIKVMTGSSKGWRWGFFIGIAIGLLAKGPITLVLCGFPILIWASFKGNLLRLLKELPWIRGSLLVALISFPWYVLAELKTPGFLDYFIVGEHFRRFVVSGWEGDLYGSAHDQPRGMIWFFLILT